jgi:hypothetical protein
MLLTRLQKALLDTAWGLFGLRGSQYKCLLHRQKWRLGSYPTKDQLYRQRLVEKPLRNNRRHSLGATHSFGLAG